VRGYEVVTDPDPVVVMETLDGETVAHLVDRHPDGLPAGEVAWLGIHLASALRYLHGTGWCTWTSRAPTSWPTAGARS